MTCTSYNRRARMLVEIRNEHYSCMLRTSGGGKRISICFSYARRCSHTHTHIPDGATLFRHPLYGRASSHAIINTHTLESQRWFLESAHVCQRTVCTHTHTRTVVVVVVVSERGFTTLLLLLLCAIAKYSKLSSTNNNQRTESISEPIERSRRSTGPRSNSIALLRL